MVTEVIMPKLGQTMEEGKIERWLKKEGDPVKKGEILLEITTDKATLEVESYGSGILKKIIVPEGETVPVTTVIGYVGEKDEALPEAPEKGPGEKKTGEKKPELEKQKTGAAVASEEKGGTAPKEDIKASPLAKKLALQKGVDLSRVKGSGPGGRITKDDVLAAESGEPGAVGTSGISPMRKAIAEQMSRSKREIPHYYVTVEVDMSGVAEKKKNLPGISYTHMLIKAVATALTEFPQINAVWEGDGAKTFKEVNLGVAVALEEGLIVPVLRNAAGKSLKEISAMVGELAERAKKKKLKTDEYSGGTFTVSNLGMFGVDNFIPIINPPEVGILGIGAIRDACVAVEGKVEIRPFMKLTLSADHRAVDGAYAGQFLNKIKTILENADF